MPHRSSLWLALALALPLWACTSSSSTTSAPCDLTLSAIAPSSGFPGDEASVLGRPFTSAYDTAVYVGSARATVLSVTREGCEAWDDCLEEQACTGCDDCDDCDVLRGDCVEAISFTVPEAGAGEAAVQVFNRHGESNALPFEVLAPPDDTDADDTDADDTDADDTDADDTDADDTDADDTDTDTGAVDTAGGDTAAPNADTSETAEPDTAQPDTATPPE